MNKFVSIHIDRDLVKPLYLQIYEGLTELIEKGTVSFGEKLPPIRRMASFFDVNTVTIVKAYKQLETMGYVESRMGSGTYVCFNETKFDDITETMKFSEENGSIRYDFASASISPKYFPVNNFKKVINEVLDRDGGYALEYQESAGYQPLRESVKNFIEAQHGLEVSLDEIQIVSGAQQGIDILAKAFLDHKDVVYVEAPTYPGAVNAFKSRGASVVEINMQEDGIDLNDLDKKIRENPPTIFYTMPVFQNPTGYSYSLKKKKELLALSEEYDFFIIEDDHISELYYDEKPALLKTLDNKGKVFYIKSFSKLFLPGLRLAFLLIPQHHYSKIALAKYSSDISSSGLSQRAMDLFLRKNLWADHVSRLRNIFYKKWQKTSQALEKHMPEGVEFHNPKGGHFFWVQLPKGLYATNLYNETLKRGVSIMPGGLFYVHQRPSESFRLSIAQISAQDIDAGIALLAESIKHLDENPHRIIHGPGDRPLL